jgi:hypothetical protein
LAALDEDVVEKILATYPPDRLRNKTVGAAEIDEAVKDGSAPEDLLEVI